MWKATSIEAPLSHLHIKTTPFLVRPGFGPKLKIIISHSGVVYYSCLPFLLHLMLHVVVGSQHLGLSLAADKIIGNSQAAMHCSELLAVITTPSVNAPLSTPFPCHCMHHYAISLSVLASSRSSVSRKSSDSCVVMCNCSSSSCFDVENAPCECACLCVHC